MIYVISVNRIFLGPCSSNSRFTILGAVYAVAIAFAILILCLQQFDGLILGPKILGNSTGMKPLWIIFAITVGGSIAGIIGMFLGVPVVAFLSYLFDRYLNHRLRKKNISDAVVESALKNMELDD